VKRWLVAGAAAVAAVVVVTGVAWVLPMVLADYGMAPPENPVAAIDPKVTIEFHIFMDLR